MPALRVPAGSALAVVAIASFAIALLLAGIGLPEYSHRIHPVAVRGALGLPWAGAYNLAAFLLPGALLLWAGQGLRAALDQPGWSARIGIVLAQLSALAFAGQGLLPLDLDELDSRASRLHMAMWMLWWIPFVPGMLLLAVGMRGHAGFRLLSLAAGVLVPALAVLAPVGPWVGLAQRLAFAGWFGWWLAAGRLRPGS